MSILRISTEQEVDGRWVAEIEECPGVIAYALTEEGAIDTVLNVWKSVRQELKQSRGVNVLPWF